MSHSQPARTAILLILVGAIVAVLGYQSSASSSPAPAPPTTSPHHHQREALGEPPRTTGPLGEADGAVPDDTTVFDDSVPGVTSLDPALLSALRQAATDAGDAGVRFLVDSGWRSPAYQEHLLQQAVAQYGSEAQAARWVAPPDTSLHVSGDAVDLGSAGAAWLSAHGAAYGLCQVYANEPWHYELRTEAIGQGCPAMYGDPTQDPRLQP